MAQPQVQNLGSALWTSSVEGHTCDNPHMIFWKDLGLLYYRVRLDESFPMDPCSTSRDTNSLRYDLGPHQDQLIPVVKILLACPSPYKFKNSHTYRFCMVTPHSEHKIPVNVLVIRYKCYSTNRDGNVPLLDDPGRVRCKITSVVCQIQQFDFECNLV